MNSAASQILVVEDDPTSRSLLEISLVRHGYSVITAGNATEAQEQLTAARIPSIACVLTDYLMPGATGLELLGWIRERDPALATILVTAQGEKALIAESLRGGATDFLDKPVDLKKLRAAVGRAAEQTWRHRRMAHSEASVKELGRAQKRMLDAEIGRCPEILQVHYYPKHEAGGDYFTHFRPSPDRLFCLLTDVSGHNLKAAYVSAYFQGLVRGLSQRGATVEEIFSEFNRFLLEESEDIGGCASSNAGVEASIAACAVLVDFATQTAVVITQGTPAPVYLSPRGEVQVVGENGGFPLGWFSALSLQRTNLSIAEGGVFYLWTDGFVDLAEKVGVSPLSLGYALEQAKQDGRELPWLKAANDDVLMATIQLSSREGDNNGFRAVIAENYHGGQCAEIDILQRSWQHSLALVAPELAPARMHDILLACREAVLNALSHGCEGEADRWMTFQMGYCGARHAVRVSVSDPGAGHGFDVGQHELRANSELVDEHRGLILLKHLASTLRFERNGAGVVMDFLS